MFTLAVIPSSTALMASISDYSSPFFSDLLPFAYLAIGFIIGGFLIAFLIGVVANALGSLIHRNK